MKNKRMILLLGILSFLAVNLTMFGSSTAITASDEWAVSEGDVYYVVWEHHPGTGGYPLATPSNKLYEKVEVTYIGWGLAAHEDPPTSNFSHSLNVTGYVWNGQQWNAISPGSFDTQLTIYNASNTVWFCGGLYGGAPCLAPMNYGTAGWKSTLQTNCNLLWEGTSTITDTDETTAIKYTCTNGTVILEARFETNGFITYYKLTDDEGNDKFECNISTEEPDLPTPDIPGYDIFVLLFSAIGIGAILVRKKYKTN